MSIRDIVINVLLILIISLLCYYYIYGDMDGFKTKAKEFFNGIKNKLPKKKNKKKTKKKGAITSEIPDESELDKKLDYVIANNTANIQKSYGNQLNTAHISTLPKVYINIRAGNSELGQIVIKLYSNIVPKTCENFRVLCSGERGYTNNGTKISYKNSIFHRIIPNFMIQGGDIPNGDGTGKLSIYGDSFNDESFEVLHDQVGVVSMANSGPDTNGCQFFITTSPQPQLDGKHVAFGQIIAGIEIINEINELGSNDGTPLVKISVSDCGLI